MVINDGFYLHGFTRIDKGKNGEAGAVFVRYAAQIPENPRKPEIRETGRFSNPAARAYALLIQEPAPQAVSACAIVTRTSKNCYQATVYDERRIESFKADSLDGLRRTVADFFEEGAA